MKKNTIISACLLSLLLGCSPDMDLTNPNKVTTGNYYTDSERLEHSINASYNMMQRMGCWSRRLYYMLNAKGGDWDFTYKAAAGMKEVPPLVNYTVTGSNENLTQSWTALYAMTYAANLALEKIQENMTVDDEMKKRLLGEAHFLRGFAYLHIAQLWGEEIPYIANTPESFDDYYPFNSQPGFVYGQIVEDLKTAAELLPIRSKLYANADNIGRTTQGTALAYLARTYLYRPILNRGEVAEWDKARQVLWQIIDSQEYDLAFSYRDNHTEENENNVESLFEVQFKDAYPDAEGGGEQDYIYDWGRSDASTWRQQELGMYDNVGGSWWNMCPSPFIVDEYEIGDPRKEMSLWMDKGAKYQVVYRGKPTWITYDEWFTKAGNVQRPPEGTKVYGCRKYCGDVATSQWDTGINERLMRYADIYLMYAECLIELENPNEAVTYINKVRQRANHKLTPTDADKHLYYTQIEGSLKAANDLLDQPLTINGVEINTLRRLLKHERVVEFFGEGLYYFDLLRWKANKNDPDNGMILDRIKVRGFVEGRNEFYPYPSSELDANKNLHGNAAN